jgi:hypothetical protein
VLFVTHLESSPTRKTWLLNNCETLAGQFSDKLLLQLVWSEQ